MRLRVTSGFSRPGSPPRQGGSSSSPPSGSAAGIGSPERFFASLRAAGLTPATRAFPDHYEYRDNPFAGIDADSILITEKDAVKFGAWRDARIWVVPVEAVLSPRLIALVVEKLRGRTPA